MSEDAVDAPIDWSTVDSDVHSSICGLPPGDQMIPASGPAATWGVVGEVSIPMDSLTGPLSTNGMHACYVYSPTGALFAAAGLVADERVFGNRSLIATRAAHTGAVQKAIATASVPLHSQLTMDPAPRIAGYQFSSVVGEDVTLMLALLTPATERSEEFLTSVEVELVWENGDWEPVMQESMSVWSNIHTVANLDRFIEWSSSQY